MPSYKGFVGMVEVDDDEKMLIGHVINLAKDGITSAGKTVEDTERDFGGRYALSQVGSRRGLEPDKPFRGEFLVRTSPELHRGKCRRECCFQDVHQPIRGGRCYRKAKGCGQDPHQSPGRHEQERSEDRHRPPPA